MLHDLIFALCCLTLMLGTIWLLVGIARHAQLGMLSARTVRHMLANRLIENPRGAAIDFGIPASSNSLIGGWSRIRRSIRAHHSTHMAAR
jgi:hypothetical protein